MSYARKASGDTDFRGPLDVTKAATFVVDCQDIVIGWSPAAQELLGYRPTEIIGRPVGAYLTSTAAADPPSAEPLAASPADAPTLSFPKRDLQIAVHRDGHRLQLVTAVCHLAGTGAAQRVVVAADREQLVEWESRLAMLDGLATQSPLGFAIYDTERRLVWCNAASEKELGRPLAELRSGPADELYPRGRVVTPGYPESLDAVMRQVLETGEPILDLHFLGEQPSDPGRVHLWSCSYYRLHDSDGQVLGVCEDAFDISDRYEAQRQLNLLVEAGRRVGTTLDVIATTDELAAVAVPEFADAVEVDLAPAVLEGEVPGVTGPTGVELIRASSRSGPAHSAGALNRHPHPVEYANGSPQHRSLASGGLVLEDDTLVVPLRAGGTALGLVTFIRHSGSGIFDRAAVAVADELAARAAVSIDNARRYTRERTAALALQRQLLPQ
ncbi:PAS domain-containing protein, partial [Streptomyces sp. KR55]|uniref:PAS domain-containing protein n=1 Tax=Streptomyces sp. KR55 TaxID=3457425 RepID=UPI003FD18154